MEEVYGYVPSEEDPRDLQAQDIVPKYSLPDSYDIYRYLPPVLDQGRKPMCSACAACCNLEWKSRLKEGKFVDLSEEFIFDKRLDKDLNGMSPRDTFKIIRKYGVPEREIYKKGTEEEIHNSAVQHRIRGYARIGSIDVLKNCIVAHGPVYIALPVKSDNDQFWRGGTNMGGHAVPVVGWNTEGLIIRNSWGSTWASGGYVTLPYADTKYILEAWTMW